MRITTQMLDNSFRKAGLPVRRKSLLDYINNDNSSDTLFNVINQSGSTKKMINKKNYEKLEEAADALEKQTEMFSAEDRESIFEKIKNGGDERELYSSVEKLVESYNNTVDVLQSTEGTMNRYYLQMMKSAAADNKEALSAAGISITKEGKLGLDKEKLQAVDIEDIEKVLGASGNFIKKTAFLAGKISDNAEANIKSISNQYDAGGNSYSELLSRYDVRS